MLAGPVVPRITRDQMMQAIRVLGIDAKETRSVCITRHYVEVVLLVRNEDGQRCAAGDEVATAVIQIPITDNMFVKQEPVLNGRGDQILAETDVA